MSEHKERGRPPQAPSGDSTTTKPEATVPQDAARQLTTRIQLRLSTAVDNLEAVGPMVRQARESNAHRALGYKSWPAYVEAEFSEHLSRLAKLDRSPVVELLVSEGMSNRSIARTIGVSHQTVNNQVANDLPPEHDDEDVVSPGGGEDGVHDQRGLRPDELDGLISSGLVESRDELDYCLRIGRASEPEFEDALAKARAEGDLSRENVENKIDSAKTRTVTGSDGKTYPAPTQAPGPQPGKPRKQPLPDRYWRAAYDLEKRLTTLSNLHNEDRFEPNRARLAQSNLAILKRVRDDLDGLIGHLEGGSDE